jgi:hypothetical protein
MASWDAHIKHKTKPSPVNVSKVAATAQPPDSTDTSKSSPIFTLSSIAPSTSALTFANSNSTGTGIGNTATSGHSGEPQPSTSKATFTNSAHNASGANATGPTTPLSAISRRQAAFQEWLNTVAMNAGKPELAQLKFVGFFHSERVKTFVDSNWPAWTNTGNTQPSSSKKGGSSKKKKSKLSHSSERNPCTAHELSLAGFMLYPEERQVKCFICHRRKSLEEFTDTSDPWMVHQELFPDCPIIKLGKPARPDDYNMGNILYLLGECEAQRIEYELYQLEKKTSEMLESLKDDDEEEE